MTKRKKSRAPGAAARPLAFGLTAAQIAERTGLSKKTIWARYARGIRGEELLRDNQCFRRDYNGLSYPEMRERAKALGLRPKTVMRRYSSGIRGNNLFAPVGSLSKAPKRRKRVFAPGEIEKLAQQAGVTVNTIYSRRARGWSKEELGKPGRRRKSKKLWRAASGDVGKAGAGWGFCVVKGKLK